MLGDFVDQSAIVNPECRAALLSSSCDLDTSIDLHSEGSDHEVQPPIKPMGADVRSTNTIHQHDLNLEISQSLQRLNSELTAFAPETQDSTDAMDPQDPLHLMPHDADEVLVESSSEPKQKQNRPHNHKRFKSSVLYVVDSVDDFKVTKRLDIIWDTCTTSIVLSPAEVPAGATWLSKNNSVISDSTIARRIELLNST